MPRRRGKVLPRLVWGAWLCCDFTSHLQESFAQNATPIAAATKRKGRERKGRGGLGVEASSRRKLPQIEDNSATFYWGKALAWGMLATCIPADRERERVREWERKEGREIDRERDSVQEWHAKTVASLFQFVHFASQSLLLLIIYANSKQFALSPTNSPLLFLPLPMLLLATHALLTFAYSLCQLISWLSTEICSEKCVEVTLT